MLNIRKANLGDCKDIFRWRNDKKTRELSFESSIIPYEEHLKWYRRAICENRKTIFVGEDSNGSKIGIIRFDLINSNTYEVHVNVAPEHRGKGFGRQLITETSQLMKGKHLARIKATNLISIRVFQKSGYREISNENDVITLEYIDTLMNGE